MSACPCGKATCPKAPPCDHCLCETAYNAADTFLVCCKCGYTVQTATATAETATARVRVTVFGGGGADAEALRRAMDA